MDPRRKNSRTRNTTVTNSEVLKESELRLRKMADVLSEVEQTDESFSEACRKHGISWQLFRELLMTKLFRQCEFETKIPEEEAQKAFSESNGCLSLYTDLFPDAGVCLPEDAEESVLYVCNHLKEREKNAVLERYGIGSLDEPKTIAELADEFNVTKERVRQIMKKALDKMSSGKNREILLTGISEYMRLCEERKKKAESYKNVGDIIPEHKQTHAETEDFLSEIPIEVLSLSPRPYHCLKRMGIYTMRSLLSMPDEKLMSIRNMGRKSFEELSVEMKNFCRNNGINRRDCINNRKIS